MSADVGSVGNTGRAPFDGPSDAAVDATGGVVSPAVAGTTGGDVPGLASVNSAPAVAEFRTPPGALLVLGPTEARVRWTLRVEVPEVWDVVRMSVPPDVPVREVKRRALVALLPDARSVDDFVVKLNGGVVLDEHAPVADVGARDGSIFLVTHRRRRPVR